MRYLALKAVRDGAFLSPSSRVFQSFAAKNLKERSVSVSVSVYFFAIFTISVKLRIHNVARKPKKKPPGL